MQIIDLIRDELKIVVGNDFARKIDEILNGNNKEVEIRESSTVYR